MNLKRNPLISLKSKNSCLTSSSVNLINGSKLAGILIESFISDSNQNLLNIGLGININSSPDNVGYKTTNLRKENVNINPKELLVYFFQCLIILWKFKIKT